MPEASFCACCGAEQRPAYDFGPWRAVGPIGERPQIYFGGLAQPEVTAGPARVLAAIIRNGGSIRVSTGIIISTVSWHADGARNLATHMSGLRKHLARITGGAWAIVKSGPVYALRAVGQRRDHALDSA